MEFKRTKPELLMMQAMPLAIKVRMSADRIEGWYERYDHYSPEWGDDGPPGVYASFSGGKDNE